MRSLLHSLILAGAVAAPFVHAQNSPTSAASPTNATQSPSTPTPANAHPETSAAATAPAAKVTTAATTTESVETKDAVAKEEATPAPAPAATNQSTEAVLELTKRLSAMEQLLVSQRERELIAQRDHEVSVYRDTNRLITIFGVTFAAIGVIALLAAAYLNFRGLAALQAVSRTRTAFEPPAEAGPSLLESGRPVPGMERVQASGQRFQSRMSSLEHRLADLEHIAGRDPSPTSSEDHGVDEHAQHSVEANLTMTVPEAEIVEPPKRVIPRAALMVHKAQALMNLGKLDEALSTLDEAITIDRTRGEVHLARGQVLEKLGRLGDALLAYEAAVDSDATNTGALLMKAGILNRQERFSEALACYERALEVSRSGT